MTLSQITPAVSPLRVSSLDDIERIERRPYQEFMPYANTYEALAAAAVNYAQRPALSYWQEGDPGLSPTSWNYGELLADVHRTARLFKRLAGNQAPRVAMLLPAIPAAYLTLWGGETAGVVCPINYLLQPEHVADLVRAAGCNILVALGPCEELTIWSLAAGLSKTCPGLRAVVQVRAEGPGGLGHVPEGVVDFWSALEAEEDRLPEGLELPGPGSLAALFHTGGTTGTPKLAQHLHGNQLHVARGAAAMYGMSAEDSIINGFPLFHVAGSMVYGLSMLMMGAHVHLPTLLGFRHQGFMRQYWNFVSQHRLTLATAVPTGIATLLALPRQGSDLSSLRAMITGGSPLPEAIAEECEQELGLPVRNTLGMTESAGVIAIEPIAAPRVRGSCGWRLPYTEAQVIDPAAGTQAPAGEMGVLRTRGPNVSPGYTDERRNRGTFEQGWLISGDLARMDESGRIYLVGRSKDIIIRNSHNIDPQQVEDALMSHPDVQLAAVVGQPDEYAGELPVAFLMLREGARTTLESLRQHAEQYVAERPAWPKHYELLESLPLTAVGKVYKPELRRRAIERVMTVRLEEHGLQGHLQVRCEDQGQGLRLRFVRTIGSDLSDGRDLDAALALMMRRFALDYVFSYSEPEEAPHAQA